MICINKYNKYYFEKYALLSICHLLNLEIKDFEHKDKPDLQSEKLDVGIEVVQAITEHDGITNYLVDKYFGKGLSGNQIVNLVNENNTRGRFKGSVFSVNGTAVISDTKGLYNFDKHRKLIAEKIEGKSQLFMNYKHYKTNGLYCFAHTCLLNEVDYSFIIDSCKKSSFNIIFINCIDTILQWNISSNNFIVHEVSSEYLAEWKRSAQKSNQE